MIANLLKQTKVSIVYNDNIFDDQLFKNLILLFKQILNNILENFLCMYV